MNLATIDNSKFNPKSKKIDQPIPEIELIRLLSETHEQIAIIKDSYQLEFYTGVNRIDQTTAQCNQTMAKLLQDFARRHHDLLPDTIDLLRQVRSKAIERCARAEVDCEHKIYTDSLMELDQRVYARTTDATGGKPHRTYFMGDFQDYLGDKNFYDDCEFLTAKMEQQFPDLLPADAPQVAPCSDLFYDTAKMTNRFIDENPRYENCTLAIIQYLKHQPRNYLDRVIKNIQAIKIYDRGKKTNLVQALENNHRFASILDFSGLDYETGKNTAQTIEY